ncbi:hypothetical protein EDD22DRAFT_924184 [Suillus occidentalis]|nr:hypothetical protein EDD22DRAFT_924184 [Suillus occidentalis]
MLLVKPFRGLHAQVPSRLHQNQKARVCHYVQLLASSWWPVILGLVANISTSTLLIAAVMVLVAALPVHFACTNRHYGCCQRNDNGEEGETHYGGVFPR